MSGGSWDYLYMRIEEAAGRLKGDKNVMRSSLGRHLVLVAQAMHDIEWNDSGDGAEDERGSILAVMNDGPSSMVAEIGQRLSDLRAELDSLDKDYRLGTGG